MRATQLGELDMKVGFIGTGVIAKAMVQGIAEDGHDIFVTERNRDNSRWLAETYANVTVADSQTVVDESDVIILALLDKVARELLPTLNFRPKQELLSVMVGIEQAELAELIQPATFGGTFIPYPHIASGGSPLFACPVSDTLTALFGANNTVIPVADESMLNSYLAAQAILCPTVKLLHETSQWLGQRVGDMHSAETFIRVLVGSYLTAVDSSQPDILKGLVDALGTEGGLNAQLRDHFTNNDVHTILEDGLNQLEARMQG